MGRILSALLIMLLVLSHGPVGASAPHSDGTAHDHILIADHHDDDLAAGHHRDAETDETAMAASTGSDEPGATAPGLGHHVHVIGDGVPVAPYAFLERRPQREQRIPVDDARLSSSRLAPIPEPPSA